MKTLIIIQLIVTIAFIKELKTCTSFIITRGATIDSSVIITYNADSHTLYGELYFFPAAEYPDNTWVDIYEWDTGKYLGKIRQAKKTYTVIGNMNEHQVIIVETTYGGRKELRDTTAILDYGSLIYITLQRAKSAREAIKIMTELVAEYGYYSEGETFSIADPYEAWIMEIIGKGSPKYDKKGKIIEYDKGAVWVAIKIPDGYVSAHANHPRITTFKLQKQNNFFDPNQTIFHSPDVISFARKMGYFNGKDEEFSFSDVYGPIDFGGARFCEARVWSFFRKINDQMDAYEDYAMGFNLKNRMPLYIKPNRKLSVLDVINLNRDYFEGTKMDLTKDIGAGPFGCPVRWRPLTWKVDTIEYFNERATSTQQTGFTLVAQARSWLPNHIGGILWFGVDDSYLTCYTPIYCGSTRVPEAYAVGNGSIMEFSETAAFWIFNQVSNFVYTRFNAMINDVKTLQTELENKYYNYIQAIDKAALELYKKDPNLAREFLTDFSVLTANETVKKWKKLYQDLFVKYMDGNIKTKIPGKLLPKVEQPGYGIEWYKLIIEKTGDRFLYRK